MIKRAGARANKDSSISLVHTWSWGYGTLLFIIPTKLCARTCSRAMIYAASADRFATTIPSFSVRAITHALPIPGVRPILGSSRDGAACSFLPGSALVYVTTSTQDFVCVDIKATTSSLPGNIENLTTAFFFLFRLATSSDRSLPCHHVGTAGPTATDTCALPVPEAAARQKRAGRTSPAVVTASDPISETTTHVAFILNMPGNTPWHSTAGVAWVTIRT